jgi:mannose-6-phosphate isomerase-like protein (cupin superfamily)
VSDLIKTLNESVGRYLDKRWDWHAFPSNDGYPELERAQMRYIGSGGSPKADASSLPAGAFSCSLIFQEPGRKASVHHHKIEELFFVHAGVLTMTWQFGDETIDFTCGPGDAVLNPPSRPHGFRNDGPDDCVLQIMVATAAPMLPTYTDHPADHPTSPLRPAPTAKHAEYVAEIDRYVARASRTRTQTQQVDGGTFTAAPYVMDSKYGGLVMPTHFCFALDTLTRGGQTAPYARPVEEAFMVIDGVLDVEFIDGTQSAVQRLGPRDLALVPAGIERRLRNSDAATTRFASIVGEPVASPTGWRSGLAAARA